MNEKVEVKFGDKVKYNDDWSVDEDRCFVCNKPLGKNFKVILVGANDELVREAEYNALNGQAGYDAPVGSSCIGKFEQE